MEGFRARLSQAIDRRLRELRACFEADRRLTPKTVAIVSGVDYGNFHKLTTGKKRQPAAETVYRLSCALDVDLYWLINGIEPSGLNQPMEADMVDQYATACAREAADSETSDARALRDARGTLRPDAPAGVGSSRPDDALRAVGDDAQQQVEGFVKIKASKVQQIRRNSRD